MSFFCGSICHAVRSHDAQATLSLLSSYGLHSPGVQETDSIDDNRTLRDSRTLLLVFILVEALRP